MAAGLARAVHEHLEVAPDEQVAAGRGDRVLLVAQLGQALGDELRGHLTVEGGAVGSLFSRVREEPAPVELGLVDEVEQLIVVVLGLARVADDEVRPERSRRLDGADVGDAGEELLAVAPPAHAAHERRRDVLERQIEVRNTGVEDGTDEVVGEVARVQVQQANAIDPGGDLANQWDDRPLTDALISSESGEVLCHQHDLAGPQRVDLAQDVVDGARPLLAAERGDGAEAAVAVAAFGHLDVRPRRRRPGPRQVEEIERRERHTGGLAGERYGHAEPDDRVGLGHGFGQLVAVALGETPGDHDLGVVTALGAEGEHGVDGLLAGLFDEGAGVDHDQVGGFGRRRGNKPIGEQRAGELVGVDLVLGAAERFHPERPGHRRRSYRYGPGRPASLHRSGWSVQPLKRCGRRRAPTADR